MTNTLTVFDILYWILSAAYLIEAISITLKCILMRNNHINVSETGLYEYMIMSIVAGLLMSVRCVMNIFMTDSSIVSAVRITSNIIWLIILHLGIGINWRYIRATYLLGGKGNANV